MKYLLPALLLLSACSGEPFTVREPPPPADGGPLCPDGEVDNPLWGCWYPPPADPADAATADE